MTGCCHQFLLEWEPSVGEAFCDIVVILIYLFSVFKMSNTQRQRYVLNHVNSEGKLERRDFTDGKDQVNKRQENKSVTDG